MVQQRNAGKASQQSQLALRAAPRLAPQSSNQRVSNQPVYSGQPTSIVHINLEPSIPSTPVDGFISKPEVQTKPVPAIDNPEPKSKLSPLPSPRVFSAPPREKDPEKERVAKEKNREKNIKFQMDRAEAGIAWAQYAIGLRYLKGDGLDKNETLARQWLEAAAAQGDTGAAKKLGELDEALIAVN